MDLEHTLPIILALLPFTLGILSRAQQASFDILRPIGLIMMGVLSGAVFYMQSMFEVDSSPLFLAYAVLLSAFCVVLVQEKTQQASINLSTTLIILGLALGALLSKEVVNGLFLVALTGHVIVSLFREKPRSSRMTITLLHLILAMALILISIFSEKTHQFISLFLAMTFLPLAPFHLPFMRVIENAKGALASFWIVVWLSIGLAQLQQVSSELLLSDEILYTLSVLALISAVLATLSCLGQRQWNRFIASATVAHVALLWGLLEAFPNFSRWGISFGVALAFGMSSLCLAFALVRQRYGWQTIGKLPGLFTPMPRLGILIILILSFAMFLPLLPTLSGLTIMPLVGTRNVEIVMIFFLFLVIWLGGSWYFSQVLHQTAFGAARSDVSYKDLQITEIFAVSALLLGATYSGLLY